ncbi:aminoglycoside phosphotransferase family protein [Halobacillus litoralis]|uniref:aminoglycoside phosphotransferase family protein n=1 Tax=Halobacillus litoralis TaxID=45668 RepID=UPI001CD63023|nr:phosphotransferase [Halobacillus litoralis]MCA0969308.1 aminoglycoside phosphotransferase family protein [Halobacillus litoralis]
MSKYEKEEKLSGGNISDVYRIGNNVVRKVKPGSERVHKLLDHLEKKGYPHAPRFKGIDEQGREILSFIQGEAGNYPLKPYMWSQSSLTEIAKMLRRYHDAVSDFPFSEDWEPLDLTPDPKEVVCHNDFAIYNIIFQEEKPVGIIDFDMTAPGPRLWDVAYALYTCVPLSRLYHTEEGEAVFYQTERDRDRIKHRVERFFEAYGIEGLETGYLDMVERRLEALCETMKRKACEGDKAFQKMIDEGHMTHYQEDIRFIRRHGHEWQFSK